MVEFVLVIDRKDKQSLGSIRCIGGLKAAEDENHIWLRGIDHKTIEDIKLRQLPARHRFLLDAAGHLFLIGEVTPIERLKEMDWLALDRFITVELPASAHPGNANSSVAIKIIPSAHAQNGVALLTGLSIWKTYAATAPASRLKLLQFAVSENSEVLIIGNPLPSIPGREYWSNNQILLPCGYDFEIQMAAGIIQSIITGNNNSIIVFNTDGNWFEIDRNFFVPAKRSAVRLTEMTTPIPGQ